MNTTSAITDQKKLPDNRCIQCFLKTYHGLFEKYGFEAEKQAHFRAAFDEIVQTESTLITPEVQQKLNVIFSKLTGITDPFAIEKEQSNQLALSLYHKWKPQVLNARNPFEMAVRLSIAGNIMDYGASNTFDLHQTIDHVLASDFAINHTALLHQRILSANNVLYLGDNAGEIVFDRLFIEIMMHNKVTFAVKSAPALNDITMKDAMDCKINKVAEVISNGFDAPSTLLHQCSPEFLEVYRSANVIISKGQGNLEGLIGEKDPRIFFLLMVKCDLVAGMLGVNKGNFVVLNNGLNLSMN